MSLCGPQYPKYDEENKTRALSDAIETTKYLCDSWRSLGKTTNARLSVLAEMRGRRDGSGGYRGGVSPLKTRRYSGFLLTEYIFMFSYDYQKKSKYFFSVKRINHSDFVVVTHCVDCGVETEILNGIFLNKL